MKMASESPFRRSLTPIRSILSLLTHFLCACGSTTCKSKLVTRSHRGTLYRSLAWSTPFSRAVLAHTTSARWTTFLLRQTLPLRRSTHWRGPQLEDLVFSVPAFRLESVFSEAGLRQGDRSLFPATRAASDPWHRLSVADLLLHKQSDVVALATTIRLNAHLLLYPLSL